MGVSFICDPKRALDLIAAIEKEIGRVAAGDISDTVLQESREALKKGWERSQESNRYLAQSYANSVVIYKMPFSRLDKRPGLYAGLSAEALRDMAGRLLRNGPALITLYPEGWTGK
jgi:hypothetical protein